MKVAPDAFPTASSRITESWPPSVCAGFSVISKLPSSLTIPSPIILLLESRIITLAPTSPFPVKIAPSRLTLKSIAASGPSVSGRETAVSSETLPTASANVTVTF